MEPVAVVGALGFVPKLALFLVELFRDVLAHVVRAAGALRAVLCASGRVLSEECGLDQLGFLGVVTRQRVVACPVNGVDDGERVPEAKGLATDLFFVDVGVADGAVSDLGGAERGGGAGGPRAVGLGVAATVEKQAPCSSAFGAGDVELDVPRALVFERDSPGYVGGVAPWAFDLHFCCHGPKDAASGRGVKCRQGQDTLLTRKPLSAFGGRGWASGWLEGAER